MESGAGQMDSTELMDSTGLMDSIRSERGNAAVCLLWFIFICGFVMILMVNILNIFAKKEQAAIGADQATLAATDVVLNAAEKGVRQYDAWWLLSLPDNVLNRETVMDRIGKRKAELVQSGIPEGTARIRAFNQVLSGEMPGNFVLAGYVSQELGSPQTRNYLVDAVRTKIMQNNGKTNNGKIELDEDRIAVTSYAEYETKAFDKGIPYLKQDIPYKGFGPKLTFVRWLHWGGFPIAL
jgi:hypothetical protein